MFLMRKKVREWYWAVGWKARKEGVGVLLTVYEQFACVNVSVPCAVPCQKRASDPSKLELETVVSHRLGAGRQTWSLKEQPVL